MSRMKRELTPQAKFACLTARWAQQIGLPVGNAWEPALTRYLIREWQQLGGDANAYAWLVAKTSIQLGLSV